MAKNNRDQQPPPASEPGIILFDGLNEGVEMVFEDMGPLGTKMLGLDALKAFFKQLGIDNKYTAHGLDVIVRNRLRKAEFLQGKPILTEGLIQLSDAYFDKYKNLPERPTERDLLAPRGRAFEGLTSKVKSLLSKDEGKFQFDKLFIQLESEPRMEMGDWMANLATMDEESFKEFCTLREKLPNVQLLQDVAQIEKDSEFAVKTAARLSFLRGLYGNKPKPPSTPLDTVQALLRGNTPQIQKIQELAANALGDRKAKADAAEKDLAAFKKDNCW